MQGTLIRLQPWDPVQGQRVEVLVGSSLNGQALGTGGLVWEPAIQRLPVYSLQTLDPEMSGKVQSGRGTAALTLNMIQNVANLGLLQWTGAPIEIYRGDGPALTDCERDFLGRNRSGPPDPDSGVVALSFEVDISALDVEMLTREYTGGGGVEGDPEQRGRLKPTGIGKPRNVPVEIIDQANVIGQVCGYGRLQNVTGLFENLADFGPSVGDFANYAALVAADVPEGRWATCFAEGLIRLGADPVGVITCDCVFPDGLPGAMMYALLTQFAGISPTRVRATDFGYVDTTCPYPVSFWTNNQVNVLDMVQRVAASVNAVPIVDFNSIIGVARVPGGAEILTLDRFGGDPLVTGWRSFDNPVPWWKLKMSAARVYRVHSESEIAYEDDIVLLGDYSATETYRQGNVLRWTDGARYLYVNATPGAGTAPPAATHWELYEDAPDASGIRYGDGQTLESLKPLESNANRTETRTSAAIAGQGPGATAPGDKVLNNKSEGNAILIPRPVGGAVSVESATVTGAIRIRLPQSWSFTMLRFRVEIYDYANTRSISYMIAGYSDGAGNWHNVSAQMIGPMSRALPVSFGHDGVRCCIWIGTPSSTWSYPKVRVLDFVGGYGNFAESQWDDDWQVSFTTDPPSQGTGTGIQVVSNPRAADAAFGFNMFESTAGVEAVIAAFKTLLGTAAGISGQGNLATQNIADFASQIGGSTKPEANATLGAVFGSNLRETIGGALATLNLFKTGLGTAAGISGQQYLATNYPVRLYGHPDHGDTYLRADLMAFSAASGSNTVQGLRPAEANANVTEGRTSAAIAGQGTFATLSNIQRANIGSYFNLNALSLNYTITRADGFSIVTESLTITSLGIAGAIVGQSPYATQTTPIDYNTQVTNKPPAGGAGARSAAMPGNIPNLILAAGASVNVQYSWRGTSVSGGGRRAMFVLTATGGGAVQTAYGEEVYVGDGEPGFASGTVTLTNTTGMQQSFSVTGSVTPSVTYTPASQNYFTI